jgi:hypothetical protein
LRTLFAAASALAVTLALAACGGQHPRYVATPPPLGHHARDVHRLFFAHRPPDIPPLGHGLWVPLHNGTQTVVALIGYGYTPNRAGTVGVQLRDHKHFHNFFEKPGHAFSAYGVKVAVLKVWNMPGDAHDAADVRVDLVTNH